MHILVRHGPKTHGNSDMWATYRCDAALSEDGRVVTRSKLAGIVERYGAPSRIVCSPYLRTRETAAIAMEVCGREIPMTIDVRLSEYLGNQRGEMRGTCRPETATHRPPTRETMTDLRRRCSDYLGSLVETGELVLHVTHGLFIRVISELNGCPIRGEVELVGHYVVRYWEVEGCGVTPVNHRGTRHRPQRNLGTTGPTGTTPTDGHRIMGNW